MTKRKKRLKVRWGRLCVLLGIAAILILVPALIIKCVFFDGADGTTDKDAGKPFVDKTMLRCDTVLSHKIDSLMNIPQRLDTGDIALSVYDITTGEYVYQRHDRDTLAPASCMKLVTALAALKQLGFNHRYTESIQIRGKMVGDTLKGNLLLRADADPLLESFDEMVKSVKRRGINVIDGNVYFHLEKEDTLKAHPTGKTWDIPYHKLTPLLRGKSYVSRTFLYTLASNGIKYKRNPKIKPEGKYRVIAQASNSLRDVITPMIIHSSNIKADAIFYHLDTKAGLIKDHRQHWDIRHAAEDFLVRTFPEDTAMIKKFVINDGSGLSPDNRLTADFLVKLLRYCYDDKQIRDYFINEALATPCDGERRGSLLTRLSNVEYKGRIFVKTGTLTTIGTSSLSGYINGSDGHWYIFSIINSNSPVAESRIFQDRLCKLIMK